MKVQRDFKVPLRKQSKLASAVESVVNTLVGLTIAYLATWFLFKVYGVQATHGQMFSITMWMTVISVIRSYVIRRAWNAEFWLRIDWRHPWKLKPKERTVTRYADVPMFVGGTRIPPETSAVIESRLREQLERKRAR